MSGKVVAITGASAGMGAGVAEVLAAHEMSLALAARRPDALESLAAERSCYLGQDMRLAELVAASRVVASTSARLQKIRLLADLLRRLAPDEIETAVAFLTGSPRQGRIGIGPALLHAAVDRPPAASPSLELADVDRAFARIKAESGPGSSQAKASILHDLIGRATREEQDFLIRLMSGGLRQGALEGVLLEAVARASDIPAARVRRAAMLAGALVPVARAAMVEHRLDPRATEPAVFTDASAGSSEPWPRRESEAKNESRSGAEPGPIDNRLADFAIQLFQPVQPMLAGSAADVEAALAELGEAALEYKLDGARIQVHKTGDDVRVYSRTLRDVTNAVPEISAIVRALPAREIILDAEALVLRPDGTPQPFQNTMSRFGRKLDTAGGKAAASLEALTPFFFDALYLDGQSLLDEPHTRRVSAMAGIVPARWLVPRIVTARPDEASAFLEQAIAAGHEGLMAKAVAGAYTAGRRGQAWLKIKRARTLDLVVLAAEWGHGRRRGTLSNLHLGVRNTRGGFVMLGKTFKGLTDQMLAWQTRRLLELETGRDVWTVYVRPELVVEIAFNEIQESPRYAGRLALRFARVKRYRTDKSAAEADTLDAVQAIFRQITGREPPAAP